MNRYPVQVHAQREAQLSRGLWLIKWLLLLPHYVVLAFLGIGFVVCTLVGYVVVLFTGRYPHGIHAFNVGVLRWSWRVGYYGYQVLGTDRYPPFTLADVPDYPARLDIEYPERTPRWLPLVAWLFAIPHILVVSALTSAGTWQAGNGDEVGASASWSVVGAGVLIVGVALLFTGRQLTGLHDLLVGIARWTWRVIAYVALLTPVYPPFRLDQGDQEPGGGPDKPAGSPAAGKSPAPGVAGPVIALIAGVLVLLTSSGVGIGGGIVLGLNAARDADGYVSSRTLDLASPTAAITVEDLQIQAGDAWSRDLAGTVHVRITVEDTSSGPQFLGIAAESDVDRWLTGTAHDQLVGIYDGGSDVDRADGAVRALAPPQSQTFWLAQASGTGPVILDWTVTPGNFAVVLANADGAAGISTRARVATRLPGLAGVGWTLLGGAVAGLLVAILLISAAASRLGRRHGPPQGPVATAGPLAPLPSAPTGSNQHAPVTDLVKSGTPQ